MNHKRPTFEIGRLKTRGEHGMAGLAISVYVQGRQIPKVAISIWAGVFAGARGIIVAAGSQTGYHFTTFFTGTTIRILMDMESM
jgi:hypothetical protein